MKIKEIEKDLRIDQYFLLKEGNKKVSSLGTNYLDLLFEDSTGTIEGKKWKVEPGDVENMVPGKVVKVIGKSEFKLNKMQINVQSFRLANEDEVNLDDFVYSAPTPVRDLINELSALRDNVKDPDCTKIMDYLFDKYYFDYIDYPAATKNHHEYLHGLIYHSVSMAKTADFIAKQYADNLNRDLLITGCLLHDIGKIVELSGRISATYTKEGILLGHLTIGMEMINEAAKAKNVTGDIPLLLEHMLVSHHGKLEYGAAVLPKTKEALLLSMIDDMDAKMMMVDKALESVEEGEFTEKIFPLDNRTLYKVKK